MTLITFN